MTISEVETAINDGRPEESRFDRKQVSNGLYNTAQAGLIRRVASGVYIYNAREPHMEKVTTDDHVYEIIGKLDDGSTIVRGDNGTLFVLVSLPMFFTTTYVSTKEA